MFVSVNGLLLAYDRFDGEGAAVVLLHGWGASKEAMRGLFAFLKDKGKTVLMLDLPGFGQSDLPPGTFGVYEYAETVKLFLSLQKLDCPVLLGHSFGGRIGIILGSWGVAKKLLLTDSAGIKPRFSLSKQLKIWRYKLKKRMGKTDIHAGSADYKALDDRMKPVFVRIVNTPLNREAAKIRIPTLLVWGDMDTETPLYMAKRLNRLIADSGLVLLKGCGHFAYADNFDGFCAVMWAFLKS